MLKKEDIFEACDIDCECEHTECDKCELLFVSVARLREELRTLLDVAYDRQYCPNCGEEVKGGHFCNSCNQRYACSDDIPIKFLNEIKECFGVLLEDK